MKCLENGVISMDLEPDIPAFQYVTNSIEPSEVDITHPTVGRGWGVVHPQHFHFYEYW